MKIIFLDIDGVLNSLQSCISVGGKSYDYEGLSRTGVGLVKKLCEITGAKIVISSTWRSDGHEAIAGAFAVCGWRSIIMDKTVVGSTPQLWKNRGTEVQEWLERTPSCSNYVIIDDDADMLDTQMENFVQTDGLIGFTIYDMVKAMNILGAKEGQEDEMDRLHKVVGEQKGE